MCSVFLCSIMPTVRSIISLPIPGIGLMMIIISAGTDILSMLIVRSFIIGTIIGHANSVRARLQAGVSGVTDLRLLIHFTPGVLVRVIMSILVSLKSRRFVLLRSVSAVVLRILRGSRIIKV